MPSPTIAQTASPALETALVPLGPAGSALEREWAELHDRCAADPFLHPGVLRAWSTAFAGGPIALATARRGGELVAALPLRPAGRRALAGAGNWHTVRTAPLALDAAATQALAERLFDGAADRVELERIDAGDAAALRATAERRRFRMLEEEMINAPYLDVEGSYDDLVAGWPKKRRHDLARRRRKLDGLGTVRMESATGGAAAGALFDALLELEAAQGWKAARGTAIAQHADTRAYYRELLRLGEDRGWLRVDALRLDERPIAVTLGLQAHGVYYGVKMGADMTVKAVSPMILLVDALMRRCFEEGLRRVELLGSDDDYKRPWRSGTHELVRLRAFSPSPRGRLAHAEAAWARPLAARLRARSAAAVARRRQGGAPATTAPETAPPGPSASPEARG